MKAGRADVIEVAGAELDRILRLYMAGAAEAFERGKLFVFQTLAARPGERHRPPLTRAHIVAQMQSPMSGNRTP
jgi:hypothetical protein